MAVAVLGALGIPTTALAATYYVSSGIGSDANTATQAQSKATPWAHLPGMVSLQMNGSGLDPALGATELTANGALGVGALGPFVDWFPDEKGGLHVGVMLGLALLGLTDSRGRADQGFAGSLWGGYDLWIGDQWSLGLEVRAAAVRASRAVQEFDATLSDTAATYEIVLSALYH